MGCKGRKLTTLIDRKIHTLCPTIGTLGYHWEPLSPQLNEDGADVDEVTIPRSKPGDERRGNDAWGSA